MFGAYADGQLVGVGGLNRDPYVDNAQQGRVRHLYVLAEWRRSGVGRQLMDAIIQAAQTRFRVLTLRTRSAPAAAFYTSLDFNDASDIPEATHFLHLE